MTSYICVIDQACSVKMAGYWPSSFFAFLWTETKSRYRKTQKRTWQKRSSFGLVYNHGKLVIINYHKDLVLEWLKGSEQLLWT